MPLLTKSLLCVSATVALLLTIYIYSFRTSSLVPADLAYDKYNLRILGIDIPLTPVVQTTYRNIYWPLLYWKAKQLPVKIVRGRLHYVNSETKQVSITIPKETYDISCRFDDKIERYLQEALGKEIYAEIGYVPGVYPENYDYNLKSISQ